MAVFSYIVVTLLGALGARLYPSARHYFVVFGVRPFESSANIHGIETQLIADTVACEDLEYHVPSGMLYTACVGDLETARTWNPGVNALERPDRGPFGSIVIIDPATLKAKKLSPENFEGPFATHGIALHTPPSTPDAVYIYAVNHLPNPRWAPGSTTEEKAASQIELFIHKVGSDTVRHLRSIAHPLIRTPNDLLAVSENEFLVTNDHRDREGPMRLVEDLIRPLQGWTDLVHVRFDGKGVDAAVVLDTIPTNNGLGWGPDRQVIVSDGLGGHVYYGGLPGAENRTMSISHHVPIDCMVDNPTFFVDPYADIDVDGRDYSGYLMPGLADAVHFLDAFRDPTFQTPIPSQVWYLPAIAGRDRSVDAKSLRRLIFKDDGRAIRSATTAVLVPIDPAASGGRREGWLFVTSVIGQSVLATKINFKTALV